MAFAFWNFFFFFCYMNNAAVNIFVPISSHIPAFLFMGWSPSLNLLCQRLQNFKL